MASKCWLDCGKQPKIPQKFAYVGFFLYLCTVIQFVRKYAYVIVLALMSAFVACMIADEWSDMRHAWQDIQLEATAEIEVEDFEWDEFGGDNCNPEDQDLTPTLFQGEGVSPLTGIRERGFISDKQRLGLVRRYALRKAILRHNYALT